MFKSAVAQGQPEVIVKYGRFIHELVGMKTDRSASVFQHTSISNLKRIDFRITDDQLSRSMFYDIVRRNKLSLMTLDITGVELCPRETLVHNAQSDHWKVLAPGPNLTSLSLSALCMTRKTFSAILQQSPMLNNLQLHVVMVLLYHSTGDLFQHHDLRVLVASISQTTTDHDDNAFPDMPSLFVHFPRLKVWAIVDNKQQLSEDSIERLRTGISDHCPDLTRVGIYSGSDEVEILLDRVFARLEYCNSGYQCLNSATLIGLLRHQETLTSIDMIQPSTVIQPDTPDSNPSAKKLVALNLRSCRRLLSFSIPKHQVDIATAETYDWVCNDLRALRVRFQGLETASAIDGCLDQLVARKSVGAGAGLSHEGNSVGERVCRVLLRFKKFKTVWLGNKDYYLPTH
ncbi:hypothetical protein BGX33_000097 [Mortierella sp. NVP41]|nr:hypothetical protein BGX33_000097 [Mortierella sp. NVP41]